MQYLSNLANAMLEKFARVMPNELQWYSPVWSEFGVDKTLKIEAGQVGKNAQVIIPLKTGRNQGVGFRNEPTARGTIGTDVLPAPGRASYAQTTATMAYFYGTLNLTGPTIKVLELGDEVQAVNLLTDSFDDIKDSMAKGQARALFGAGDGAIARLTTSSTLANGTCTILCRTNDVAYVDEFAGVEMIEPDMVLEASSARTGGTQDANQFGTASTTCTVLTVDYDAASFTYSDAAGGAATLTNGDYLFQNGNEGQTNIMGLTGIVDGAVSGTAQILNTLQGRAGESNSDWNAQMSTNSNTNRSISELLLQDIFNKIERRAGVKVASEGQNFRILSTYGILNSWLSLMGDRRYNTDWMTLKGGFKALEYHAGTTAAIPWLTDTFVPSNCVYVVHTPNLVWSELAPMHWLGDGEKGAHNLQWRQGHDERENVLAVYKQLVTYRRAVHGVIRDVTES